MAGEEGFEPPNAWTKTMCLTTWRLPNNEDISQKERYHTPPALRSLGEGGWRLPNFNLLNTFYCNRNTQISKETEDSEESEEPEE